eukprot:12161288-Alexandrium_andersonii.AAC.1
MAARESLTFWPAEKPRICRLQHISSSMPKASQWRTTSRRVRGRWSRPAALAAMRSSQAMTT